MVVSASRRCDIPRFSFDWFLERLAAGFVEVKNPFNSRQIRQVSLLPSDAELFAFWTRDPAAILGHTADLEGRGCDFFVMTTLTSYPAVLEPNVPPAGELINTMRRLARKITPDRVIWRYDPLFLSNITDFAFHRGNFSRLAAGLNGTVKRVIVSVYDEYGAAERRLTKLENAGGFPRAPGQPALKRLAHYENEPKDDIPSKHGPGKERPLLPGVRELLAELAGIARKEGMEIQSCAEEDLSGCGIKPGACIDAEYIARLFGNKKSGLLNLPKDPGQKRPRCLCAQSVDIGSYGPCPAGCIYCYGSR